ncbi:MAG: hypothetical protein SV253_07595, partial [Halobacteria archaeon]|nr:hypothetical protein [Halobacteria archaeon]
TSALNEVSQNASQLSDRARKLNELLDEFEVGSDTSGVDETGEDTQKKVTDSEPPGTPDSGVSADGRGDD